MKRLKSIDSVRGLSILWMFVGHLQNWWLKEEYTWLYDLTFKIVDPIGSAAFIFIAGLTAVLSLQARYKKAELIKNYTAKTIRKEYLYRAMILFIVALLYNSMIAIALSNFVWIWTWFVLLTVSVSLFISWPLLKISIKYRIGLGVVIWILNQLLLTYLLPFQGQYNLNGILFHIFYHNLNLDAIFSFFPFFLFGTVVGEVIFKIYLIEDKMLRKQKTVKKLIIPLLFLGLLLVFFGIIFNFPKFLTNRSFSWMFYALGIILALLSILIVFEEFQIFKIKKSYHFLFYFSYYSLSIYISHNLLYFIFFEQLNPINIWIFILIACVLTGILLKLIYIKFGSKASLKVQIGRIAANLASRGCKCKS